MDSATVELTLTAISGLHKSKQKDAAMAALYTVSHAKLPPGDFGVGSWSDSRTSKGGEDGP